MSCDFKVGDELVCITVEPSNGIGPVKNIAVGQVYTVAWVGYGYGRVLVRLAGVSADTVSNAYGAWRFRKVERRNDRLSIEAFMTMPGGFEEPRRKAPARKGVKA